MSARCTSCLEREKRGLWGALRLVPVYSTVWHQASLSPSAAGEVLAGAGDGAQRLGTGPQAPCHHLLQPSGAADASRAPQCFLGSWVQPSFRQRHLWACSSSHQPQHHLCPDSVWCSCWLFTLVLPLSAWLSVWGRWLVYVVFACQ